jgi:hypothetical protein
MLNKPTVTSVQGIETTYYNLIDTLIHFMGQEKWGQMCERYNAYMADVALPVYDPRAIHCFICDELGVSQPVADVIEVGMSFGYVMDYRFSPPPTDKPTPVDA